jgi:2-oxoglutarate ferredoxin oxidoreductase subunit beta
MNPIPIFPKCYKESSKPHKYCGGCGHGIALKELGYAIDELGIAKKTVIGLDIGCSLLAWDFFDVNSVQTHHGRTVPVMSGFKLIDSKRVCIAYVGDGGGYAIGLQSLITAAQRNDAITVILVNNTIYGMTGGQTAPTTFSNEKTTTSPNGRKCWETGQPFMGPEIIKSLNNLNSFVARASVKDPIQLRQIIKQAINNQINKDSFSFVEVLSTCPTNWHMNAKESLNRLNNQIAKQFPVGVFK